MLKSTLKVSTFSLLFSAFGLQFPEPSHFLSAIQVSRRDMIMKLITGYFHGDTCVVVISDSIDDILFILPKVVTSVLVRISVKSNRKKKKKISQRIKGWAKGFSYEEMIFRALDLDCRGFLVNVRRPSDIIRSISQISRKGTRRVNRRYVIIPESSERVIDTAEIFGMIEMKLMPDLIIAQARLNSSTHVDVVTMKFVGKTDWRDPVILTTWTGHEFEPRVNLFPDKLSDLMGREMVFATFNYPPYAIVETPDNRPDGMEMRIAMEFARKLNVSWSLSVDAEHEWGEIFDGNGSGNGILGAVVTDHADLGYGALYLWFHEYTHLDFSRPYIRTGITCLAPKPKLLPGWTVPILPFSKEVWASVGGAIILASLALFSVNKASSWILGSSAGSWRYSTPADCLFRASGLLLLQAPEAERRHNRAVGPTRLTLNWLLLVFLMVTASYSSGLSSVLTVPKYEPPIDTASDLALSGLNWAATHEAWVFSLREATEGTVYVLYKQFRVLKEDALRRRSTEENLAFSIERLPAGYFAIGDYISEEAARHHLRPMHEDIYWEQSTTVVRKGWPHLAALDALIHQLLDSGLLLAWEAQVSRRWMTPGVQLAVRVGGGGGTSGGARDPTRLRLEHVQGGFFIMAVGLGLATLAFGMELAISRRRAKKDKLKRLVVVKVMNVNRWMRLNETHRHKRNFVAVAP